MKLLAIADDLTPGKSYSTAYRQTLSYYSGTKPRMVHDRAENARYVAAFNDETACRMLEDEGFTALLSRTVDGDSVWMRFWDFGKDVDTFRIEGADFIRTTDLDSACGEPGTLIESSNVGYAYGVDSGMNIPHLGIERKAENYLTAVKRVLSSCGNGYEEARSVFASVKAQEGIVAARKAFRTMLFEAKLQYGNYDPNGYGPGNWTARTEANIIPCLKLALDAA